MMMAQPHGLPMGLGHHHPLHLKLLGEGLFFCRRLLLAGLEQVLPAVLVPSPTHEKYHPNGVTTAAKRSTFPPVIIAQIVLRIEIGPEGVGRKPRFFLKSLCDEEGSAGNCEEGPDERSRNL